MTQTKLNHESHKCPDMHGRIPTLYKEAVEKYKSDIASGKVIAPIMRSPEAHLQDKPKKNQEKFKTTFNDVKETEQSRLF